MEKAAIGFRVKSGWAMAVLLTGPPSSPRVVDRRRIELADPAVPDSIQPFHAGLDLARSAAAKKIGHLVKCVERAAHLSIKTLLDSHRSNAYRLVGAGLVVGSIIDPETIKNDHIRAHAEEGKLFRVVIEHELKARRLRMSVTPEKELYARGARVLGMPEARIKSSLVALGKDVSGSWRAEEKAATLAAWMALASRVG